VHFVDAAPRGAVWSRRTRRIRRRPRHASPARRWRHSRFRQNGPASELSARRYASITRVDKGAHSDMMCGALQAMKERQLGLAVWLNGVLDLVADDVAADDVAAFLRPPPPVVNVTAVWPEQGPLGINFSKHLSVLATSPATQRTHPELVPGLVLVSVQDTAVVGVAYAATIELLRTASRPLTLLFEDQSQAAQEHSSPMPPVDRVEVTDGSLGSDESGTEFITFDVTCLSSQRDAWKLAKRFSDFSNLRDAMLRDAAEASPPPSLTKGLLQIATPTAIEPTIALYVCTRKTIARSSCDLDSEPLQAIYAGDEVEAVEIRHTDEGAVRVRCGLRDADLPWGWCTAQNKDGVVICEYSTGPDRRSLARYIG
jgi:hypothetical protein